ncbi:MAG TPA: anti-sigma factor [Gemmataceae bacterium]|nr:anti-sigma factor [Gemmataceae bacterium]
MHDLLNAYFDNELPEADRAAFEQHLTECPECTLELEAQTEVRVALQDEKLRYQPPPNLAARIKSSLPQVDWRPVPWRRAIVWMAAASILIGIGLTATGLGLILRAPSREDRLAQETMANHTRALQANHLLDIASTNQHKVKPWFQGKLDFAPPVENLAEQGYPLDGGRLDYVDGHNAAALVYHRRDHVINLFIWPASSADAPIRTTAGRGYNIAFWCKGGLNLWAVSDLNIDELREFAQKVQEATP